MPTFEDFLTLNSFIYDSQPPQTITVDVPGGTQEWIRLLQSGVSSDTGYYGAAYWNVQTKEIVIVNRGTNDLADIGADVLLALDVVPNQFLRAEDFYNRARSEAENRGATLSITGHSLGGSLTQLLIAKHANDEINGSRVFGQTFNAYGVKGLLDDLELPETDYAVTNWVEPTDIVGHLADHIGTRQALASLPFSFTYLAGPAGVVSLTYNSHEIDEVRENFIADNSHPLLAETREFLIQTYIADPGLQVTIDGSVVIGANNRINVGNELVGSELNDLLFGGLPDDRIHGGDGQDVIYGGDGNDTIWGETGADFMFGEDGNDTYVVDDSNDQVSEVALGGIDIVESAVSYTLSRNVEHLILVGEKAIDGAGNELDNMLVGNNESNVLDGKSGADDMAGGLGDDTYIVNDVRDRVVEGLGEGTDTIKSAVDYQLAANVEKLVFAGGASARGNALSNELTNQSFGALLNGGQGDDTYILEAAGTVVEAEGEGLDTVKSAVAVTLGHNLENLTLTGDDAIDGTGNSQANIIIGNSANNAIDGSSGHDLLMGGAGNDVYHYANGGGHDRIEDAQGNNLIIVDGQLLEGGVKADPSASTWQSLDGEFTFAMAGGDLLVSRTGEPVILTINEDFLDGQFGIRLTDGPSYENDLDDRTEFTREVPDPHRPGQAIIVPLFDEGDNGYTIAGATNDIIHALGGNDSVVTDVGNDQLFGEEGDDLLQGEGGNDRLDGGTGNDLLLGGEGNDAAKGGEGDDELQGNLGLDVLVGGTGNDSLLGDVLIDSSWDPAQAGDDCLDGGDGNDFLSGDGGSDVLTSGDGDDILWGDYGGVLNIPGGLTLELLQQGGSDTLDAGDGNDGLVGGAGNDLLFGGDGNDLLYGDYSPTDESLPQAARQTIGGADVLHGGAGNDEIYGGLGGDDLFGGSGQDTLIGGNGSDTLNGDEGNDTLLGGAGDDALNGGAGDDFLDGGEGNNVLDGGGGNDEFVGYTGNDAFSGGEGDDKLSGTGGNDSLDGGVGNDLLLGDDRITVNSFGIAEFTAATVAGADVLTGGVGNDRIYGGGGQDVLTGGTGNDLLLGDDCIFTSPRPDFAGNFIESFRYSNLSGNDQIDAGDGEDEVYGGAGDDVLSGGAGNDVVYGDRRALFGSNFEDIQLGGDDALDGGEGEDYLDAGVGDDLVLGGVGNDNLFGGDGHDHLDGGAGDDLLQGDGGGFGFGLGNDELIGGKGSDQLFGGEGSDLLDGGEGADILDGGFSGSDTYVFGGGYGPDLVKDSGFDFGEVDIVQMTSDVSSDELDVRRNGADLLFTLQGGADQLTVQNFFVDPSYEIEQVHFTDGTVWDLEAIKDRLLMGNADKRRLEGFGERDDLIQGSGGDDVLLGAGGQDTLASGAGQDQLYGGSGSDTYLFGRGSGRDTIFDAPGSGGGSEEPPPSFAIGRESAEALFASSSDLSTIRMSEDIAIDDVMVLRNGSHLVLRLDGSSDQVTLAYFFADAALQNAQVEFADGTLWDAEMLQSMVQPFGPTAASDVLHGTFGDDVLTGLGGDDLLDGRGGADTMGGGEGNDVCIVDHTGDVVQEAAGEGIDTVHSSVGFTIGSSVENLTLTGQTPIDGTGNDLDNILTGNAAANVLAGGLGDDTYMVGNEDTVIEAAGEGTDTVIAAESFTLGSNVENLTLTGTFAIDGTGNDLDNILIGNEGENILEGGAGADTLAGGKGDDIYIVDAHDSAVEVVDQGIDTVRSAASHTLGANIENLTLTGGANIDGSGNALDNVLTGNEGANLLSGGAGNDTYVVDAGDTVDEAFGEGTDTVESSFSYVLGDHVENLTLTGTDAIDATGNALDNALAGNVADNILTGGAGDDVYRFGRGSGQDLVVDNDETAGNLDSIQIVDVATEDLLVSRSNDDLILSIHGATDQLSVQAFFLDSSHQVEQIVFGDGTVWDVAAITDRLPQTLTGTSGEDTLYGGSGTDTLDGGGGNDSLYGYGGNDTYFFGSGSGQDTVLDYDGAAGNLDTIQVGSGIAPADLGVTRQGDNLLLTAPGLTDQLLVQSFFKERVYQIEQVAFADGTTWDADSLVDMTRLLQQGGNGNDFLRGVSAGGRGADDLLIGGLGDDTLLGDNLSGLGFGGADKLQGREGHDVLLGRGGDDVLEGGEGHDVLQGDGGLTDGFNGQLVGDGDVPGQDRLMGGDGDDSLYGAGGDDNLEGGLGNDLLSGDGGWGFIAFTGTAFPGDDTLLGGEGEDVLIGGSGDDLLDGGAGNDILTGGAGNDVFVFGRGYGQDSVEGFGRDGDFSPTTVNTLRFTSDVSVSDVSVVRGGDWNQNDLIFQIAGTDDRLRVLEFFGGGYTPLQKVEFSDGTVWDWNAIKSLAASITGAADSDTLTGVDLDETLTGLDGDDILDGGIGADKFIGGAGDDTYVVDNEIDTVLEAGDEGTDTVRSWVNYTLSEHVENLTLQDAFDEFGSLDQERSAVFGIGNDGDNVIAGNSVRNVLDGGAGDDTLTGGPTEVGGGDGGAGFAVMADFSGEGLSSSETGDDILIGGEGNDIFLFNFGDGIDTVVDTAASGQGNRIHFGEGILCEDLTLEHDATTRTLTIHVGFEGDRVRLASFDPNGANGTLVVETLAFSDGNEVHLADLFPPTGPVVTEGDDVLFLGPDDDVIDGLGGNDVVDGDGGNDRLMGGSGDDQLVGGTGHDVLDGGIGADVLLGGDGDDGYVVNDADDVVTEAGYEGTDTVQASVTYSLGVHIERLTLTGGQAINGAGNELDNILTGNGGANVLDGGTGTDLLAGGSGDDTYLVDHGGDLVAEMANEGTDTVLSSVSYALSANAENLTLIGSATEGTGNELDNILTGNCATNILDAGEGADTLIGGAGNDTLHGGAGDDRFHYFLGDGLDQVADTTGTEIVTFGAGISFDNTVVRLAQEAGGTVARLRLLDVYGNELADQGIDIILGPDGISPIEQFSFADGTTHVLSDLVIQTLATEGTRRSDVIRAGRHDDVIYTGKGGDTVYAGTGNDAVYAGKAGDEMYGEGGNDALYGEQGRDYLDGGSGNDLLEGGNGSDRLIGGDGVDWLLGGKGKDVLLGGMGMDYLDGGKGEDCLFGDAGDDTLLGGDGEDQLGGGAGSDRLDSGKGEDRIVFGRGDGADTLIGLEHNKGDVVEFGSDLNPLDLILSRQTNDLTVSIHGTTESFTVQDWYSDRDNRTKEFEAGNGQILANTRVDQLIQAMATYSAGSGLSWAQAIDQHPTDVAEILAANWQSS